MANEKFIFWSDIDSPVRVDAQGSIKVAVNADAVKASIHNILHTRLTERVMKPEFGSRVTGLVFEPIDEQMFNTYEDEIRRVIDKWEKRVLIRSMRFKADPDRNSVEVALDFQIRGYDEIFEATTEL